MQSLGPLDSLLLTIVLATLAIGLPVVFVLAIRFLLDRRVAVGRSKELEKLIWQLHRIASAQEHQMNLSFPPVQPGTKEPGDLVYLQSPAAQAKAAAQKTSAAKASAAPAAIAQTAEQGQPATELPPLTSGESGADAKRHGVNSMFGL